VNLVELVVGVVVIFFAFGVAMGAFLVDSLPEFLRRNDRRYLDDNGWPAPHRRSEDDGEPPRPPS
jgi:hypothetical protein